MSVSRAWADVFPERRTTGDCRRGPREWKEGSGKKKRKDGENSWERLPPLKKQTDLQELSSGDPLEKVLAKSREH